MKSAHVKLDQSKLGLRDDPFDVRGRALAPLTIHNTLIPWRLFSNNVKTLVEKYIPKVRATTDNKQKRLAAPSTIRVYTFVGHEPSLQSPLIGGGISRPH